MNLTDSRLEKPQWLKIKPPTQKFDDVKQTLREYGLVTVCEEAHCPNASECWSGGTATFMVLGDTCTRGCRFCAVPKAREGKPLDPNEPQKIAQVVQKWGLKYVVITSVDRDELADQGANHFAECIRQVKSLNPTVFVEVLIPDFRGDESLLKIVLDAGPNVLAHNIETTRSLQKKVRDYRAGYEQSLGVLKKAKEIKPGIFTKSSIMLGLGETDEEVLQTMDDLRAAGTDFLTIGQYLQPSKRHYRLREFVSPDKFKYFEEKAIEKKFLYAASGPFVRSSYRAGEYFIKNALKKNVLKSQPRELNEVLLKC